MTKTDLPPATVTKLAPGPEFAQALAEAVAKLTPGSVIEFGEGHFEFTAGLALAAGKVTLRGAGPDKTVLDFVHQTALGDAIVVTGSEVHIENLAIENPRGIGLHIDNAANDFVRHVRVTWVNGANAGNGPYAIGVTNSKNVLVEGCDARLAAQGGICASQCENVVLRKNHVEQNFAGIEVENSYVVDVLENTATNNTAGIVITTVPGLAKQEGHGVRVAGNELSANNAPAVTVPNAAMSRVPSGTGIFVLSTSKVEIAGNTIKDHVTFNLAVCSYVVTGLEITDPKFYPFPESIFVHDNTFGPCGSAPKDDFGNLVMGLASLPVPDIIWDGVLNPQKVSNGQLPEELKLHILNNKKDGGGDVTFANIDALIALTDPANVVVKRDLSEHKGELAPLAPVAFPGIS